MDAALRGQVSVEASIQGMTDLKEVVAQTAQIIQEVNAWGTRVSSILDIVDDITEQTSLLALNASIISAQAGGHGRGFAVVADEIKSLALRTKTSTKEIGTLIHELQAKSAHGVQKTSEGISKADQGVQLANAVQEALNTILDSATRSSTRAADTAQVIQQTAADSQIISASINRVTEMVSHIRTAIQKQEQDIEQVVAATESISGMAEQVNRASIEQRKATDQMAESMGHVANQFSTISDQTSELKQNVAQIVTAMHLIESTTNETLHNATTISTETVKNLLHESEVLQKIVNVFKVT
jgi:methyl-accepting chemotaxis protein